MFIFTSILHSYDMLMYRQDLQCIRVEYIYIISKQLYRKRASFEADRTVCKSFAATLSLDVPTVSRRNEDSIQLLEAKRWGKCSVATHGPGCSEFALRAIQKNANKLKAVVSRCKGIIVFSVGKSKKNLANTNIIFSH